MEWLDVLAAGGGGSTVDLKTLTLSVVAFGLAIFLGFEVITKVPATLHTPLMSGANAISGITIVGALLIAGGTDGWFSVIFGFLAMVFATINVFGGFVVTDRLLAMFKRR
ncbi:MAG: NAD(P) transhydrogenase subunit alpha [Phycisphaerales bacterium]|nr:NAD(P) transhydrogenase subunit alpha [Phycisphaerales bacterium]